MVPWLLNLGDAANTSSVCEVHYIISKYQYNSSIIISPVVDQLHYHDKQVREQEVLGKTNLLLSFHCIMIIRNHAARVQQFFYYFPCIHCLGNVFTEPLSGNVMGGGKHAQTAIWSHKSSRIFL
jgi:hypothetical protein